MLEIKDLHATVEESEILHGVDLSVKGGEVHAIMGPNGSGKSTLARVIAGEESYEVTGGSVEFEGQDLLEMGPDERAQAGVFMAFQYPVEIPGVSNMYFLREAINSIRETRGEEPLTGQQFMELAREKAKVVQIDESLLKRSLNVGFSGGEKKRNEIFQMAMMNPKLAVLDETDSGLDIDALRIVSNGVNQLRDKDRAIIVVTHYQRILDYIEPDYVHVLVGGRIVKSGDKTLASHLEEVGYAEIEKEAAQTNTAKI